ncbi:Vanadium-dependent bromoperoxidase, putative [Halomicronema hongdechloris C2206]|uniref:Vanadium-dependent bromoperoxidase, putative n=1 Tax=Halomicronema hongdechloris C2206 TaxID=1641165 RepID=A0A1Z3HMR0_9CYAN|nr:bromoperoxidase [Halomicronema hongdechloris]ASC71588.1 Vanadium-dependent bromoperoxidase, putative [Halomicronema hongdechloris C2206]
MSFYRIAGRVVSQATGAGLSGLRVEVWDKDLIFDDFLAQATTDAQGAFQVQFDDTSFRDFIWFDRLPDLYFKVFDGNQLIKSTADSVLWNSRDRNQTVVLPVERAPSLALSPPGARGDGAPPAICLFNPPNIPGARLWDRRLQALEVRRQAAELARRPAHPEHLSNGEELLYRDTDNQPSHIANYTKGLPHDDRGLLSDADAYQRFVRGIDSGDTRDFQDTPLGLRTGMASNFPIGSLTWPNARNYRCGPGKVPGAGNTFDLEGPDAQAVTMPPAPTLDSPELLAEMVEVYTMALLRDIPFAKFDSAPEIQQAIDRLNATDWIQSPDALALSPEEESRLRSPFTRQTVFRGIAPGDEVGPYLSQFLLVGNTGLGDAQAISDGYIQYGSIRADQRVRVAAPYRDYMTTWEAWLDVQNGADFRGLELYADDPKFRFMATPRDLATYVHYDALYEAYLNACLIMLSLGVPFDPGIPFQRADHIDKQQGFAHFGGPHILSLVTEVATRALKAVRFQKFNVHRRARPEAIGGLIHRYASGDRQEFMPVEPLVNGFGESFLEEIADHNRRQNQHSDRSGDASAGSNSYLLPMAFPEGSPMHPAYGAGHGTVAGACVTILKAFFDHGYELPVCYQPSVDGAQLESVTLDRPLTVGAELNKLAANIAIGRNWAGVHYFTDYIESIRLGEAIALGILEEQKLTYGENFSMTIPLFDGGTIRI